MAPEQSTNQELDLAVIAVSSIVNRYLFAQCLTEEQEDAKLNEYTQCAQDNPAFADTISALYNVIGTGERVEPKYDMVLLRDIGIGFTGNREAARLLGYIILGRANSRHPDSVAHTGIITLECEEASRELNAAIPKVRDRTLESVLSVVLEKRFRINKS